MDNLSKSSSVRSPAVDRCFFIAIVFILIVGIAVLMIAGIGLSNGLTDLYR